MLPRRSILEDEDNRVIRSRLEGGVYNRVNRSGFEVGANSRVNSTRNFQNSRRDRLPQRAILDNGVNNIGRNSQEFQRRQTYATAASFAEGDLRAQLLTAANNTGGGRSAKDREMENIRKWSVNPSDPSLREIGPGTILKNIYGFQNVDNPTAEVVLVLLALWKYGEEGAKDGVINYLKQAAINGMGYEGVRYVEFLRRALDFPRRQMIDPFRPSFQDLLISRGAQACGAKVTLPPEIYLGISTQAHPTYTKPGQAKGQLQNQGKY